MANNVVSLDDGLTLTRSNTTRSSEYSRKASSLQPLATRRLRLLEEKLFQERVSLTECKCGQLQKLEGIFVRLEGRIWYYYSKPSRKFVLLDFEFGGGGSGGLPVPIEGEGETTEYVGLAASDRWAASAACAFGGDLIRNLSGGEFCWIGLIFERLGRCMSEFQAPWPRTGFPFASAGKAARNEDHSSGLLPKWSILAPYVSTPEQLHNHYARSILAGETLCREVARTQIGKTLMSRRMKLPEEHDLFEEVSNVLGSMFAQDSPRYSFFQRFEVTKVVLQAGFLVDDCLLSLARSELTLHLCVFIVSEMKATQPACDAHWFDQGESRTTFKIMKKYALLADFISISDGLFRTSRPEIRIDEVLKDYGFTLKNRATAHALREISTFDAAIHNLVHEIEKSPGHPDEWIEDLPSLHHRLLDVTRELLLR